MRSNRPSASVASTWSMRAARFAQRGDGVAHQELHAIGLTARHQFARKAVRVARFVFRRVGGAGQLRADVPQRGLDAHRFVGRDHAPVATQRAHLGGRPLGAIELLLVRVEMQDALRALVVVDAGVAPQRLQRVAAVGAQAHDLLDVVACARRRAFTQELQAPQPLPHVGTDAEQQRCVFLAEPFQHLQRRARVGPGLGMADRDLAAVGEAGFCCGRSLPVDHADVVALLTKEVRRGDAQQAGAENNNFHENTPGQVMAIKKSMRVPRPLFPVPGRFSRGGVPGTAPSVRGLFQPRRNRSASSTQ